MVIPAMGTGPENVKLGVGFVGVLFGGALFALMQDLIQTPRSKARYLEALKFSLGWGLAMVALVYLGEYIQRKRTPESENTSGK